MSTEQTVRELVEAYDAGNNDRVTERLHDDLRYCIHGNKELACFHADTSCKAEFFDVVAKIQADWRIDSYKLTNLVVEGERAAAQIAVTATSQHTGKSMDTDVALFLTLKDGLVKELHEYHDTMMAARARD